MAVYDFFLAANKPKKKTLISVAGFVGGISALLVITAQAATAPPAIEPEQGIFTNGATKVDDTAASARAYVLFKTVGTPPTGSVMPYGSVPGTWTLKFQDEFDGTALNTAKWTPTWLTGSTGYSNPVNTLEDACNHSDQVSVNNGSLKLMAIANTNSSCKRRDGSVAPYVTGIVTSYRKFETAYGYFEARINSPGASGLMYNWPAFWTDGTALNWPIGGEIDILEALGTHKPCWHYHYQDVKGQHQGPGGCANMDGTGWHTYAANWEPGKVTFYYDGVQVGVITSGIVSNTHFIILNYGMNDQFGYHPNTSMEIDYVRVWQR